MDYKKKYLKYKAKYLALKNDLIPFNQIGGDIFQYPYRFTNPTMQENTNINTAQIFVNLKLKNDSPIVQALNGGLTTFGKPAKSNYHLSLLVLRVANSSYLYNSFNSLYAGTTFDVFYEGNSAIARIYWSIFYKNTITDATTIREVFETALQTLFYSHFFNKTINGTNEDYRCLGNNNFVKAFLNNDEINIAYTGFKRNLFKIFQYLIGVFPAPTFFLHFPTNPSPDYTITPGQVPAFSLNTDNPPGAQIIHPPIGDTLFTHYSLPERVLPSILYDPSNSLFTHSMYFNDNDWIPHLTIIQKDSSACTIAGTDDRLLTHFRPIRTIVGGENRINQIRLWNRKYDINRFNFTYDQANVLYIRSRYYAAYDGASISYGNIRFNLGFTQTESPRLGERPSFSTDRKNLLDKLGKRDDEIDAYLQSLGIYNYYPLLNGEEDIGDIESIEFEIYIGGANHRSIQNV